MPNKPVMKNRRSIKNYIILPKYQWKYISFNVGICLILAAAYFAVFYHFIKENYFAFIELGFMDEPVKKQLYSELYKIIMLMGGFTLLFLVLIMLLSIVLSHRVAGPIYKITKVIKEMRNDNKIYKITLRPNNEFQDLTKELNTLLEQFNEKSR